MGANLCCTREICCDATYNHRKMEELGDRSLSPIAARFNKGKGSERRRKSGIFTESPRQNKYFKNNIRLEYVNRVQQYQVQKCFTIETPFSLKYISFSQRRFLGFRSKFEFDKKRVLMASNHEICIISYDQIERPYELYKGPLGDALEDDSHELLMAQFLEDHIPSFVFIVRQDTQNNKVEFKILKLRKNLPLHIDGQELNLQQFSNKEIITDQLLAHIKKGDFNAQLKRKFDNIQLVPKNNVKLFKNPHFNRFMKQQNSQLVSLNNSRDNDQGYDDTVNDMLDQNFRDQRKHNNNFRISYQKSQSFKSKEGRKLKLINKTVGTVEEKLHTDQGKPFMLEEYGNLLIKGQFSRVYLFHSQIGQFLFTITKDKPQLIIYVIKSCVQAERDYDLKKFSYPKVTSFRMAKKSTVNLEFNPVHIDAYADYFLISYEQPCPFIDSFERNGQFHQRYNIHAAMKKYELKLTEITKVLFPRMKWSDRKIEEIEKDNKFLLKKFLVIGTCAYQNESEIDGQEPEQNTFIMLYNLQKQAADKLKLISINVDEITCINYGPFDNGYLLIGLSSGLLIGLNLYEMEVIMQQQLFQCPIREIIFEPTNLVFVSSNQNEVVSLNLVKKELHYVYLEIGKKQYCTVTVPHTNLNSLNGSDDNDLQDYIQNEKDQQLNNNFRICC